MGKSDVERAASLFRAMGHPIRLGVLERLRREGEICACDFTEHFGVSQPTISGHLRTLREAGLVRTRRDGTTICYSLAPEVIDEVRRMADSLRSAA
ncbi:ArsR/SmtB family transcription factor [Saccharopolyspora rosea]|uniref:ArsR/SmtB family transcription factor n=1 Tax=Saccharopolyspora rosea TaxID=524884 RepID=A0ABW3FWE9_9PSEU|nr:metalloregulator ArsR/SmtB family transcription factor [Saccharopolyspora rosea]